MKLPRYTYQEAPGAQIPSPGVPNLPAMPSSGAELIGPLARTLEYVGKVITAQEVLAAKKREISARAEAARIQATVGFSLKTFKLKLDRLQDDPDAYERQWNAYRKDTITEAYKQAADAETFQLLQLHLPQIEVEVGVAAQESINTKYVSGIEAKTLRTESMYKQSVSTEDFRESGWANWFAGFQRTVAAWEDNSDVRGKEVTEKKVKQAFNDFYDARVRQHILEDPGGFLVAVEVGMYSRQDPIEKGGRYWGMDPEKRTAAVKLAQDQIRINEDRATKEQEKFETEYEKAEKADIKIQVDELESLVFQGKLTIQDVERNRRSDLNPFGPLQDEDYRRLMKHVMNPDTPSDPGLKQHILLDSESIRPTHTESEIDRLVKPGGLNLADALQAKQNIRQRNEALRTQGESRDAKAQSEAEQELKMGLTTRSPFEALDPVSQEALTMAFSELRKRSRFFKDIQGGTGTEDPLVVLDEILPRYQSMLLDRGRLSLDAARKLTGGWTIQTADQQKAAGKITEGQYQSILDALAKLRQAEKDYAVMQERIKARKKP